MNIAFIPVRGGSKGIPLKNIKPLCGVPLLARSLSTLIRSERIDEIVVATDSEEIKRVALDIKSERVTVYDRSPENALDDSSTEDVMLEYFTKHYHMDRDNVFLVQVTNPFLTLDNIHLAANAMKKGYDSVLTVTKEHKFRWHHRGVPLNYHPKDRPRRQDWGGEYYENGALYVTTVGSLLRWQSRLSGNIGLVVMPPESAFELDEPRDWAIVEAILNFNNGG